MSTYKTDPWIMLEQEIFDWVRKVRNGYNCQWESLHDILFWENNQIVCRQKYRHIFFTRVYQDQADLWLAERQDGTWKVVRDRAGTQRFITWVGNAIQLCSPKRNQPEPDLEILTIG